MFEFHHFIYFRWTYLESRRNDASETRNEEQQSDDGADTHKERDGITDEEDKNNINKIQ